MIVAVCSFCALAAIFSLSQSAEPSGSSQYVSHGVFTPAHSTVISALNDFLDLHPKHPEQPIAYTHKVHLANGLQCTTCHIGVDQGPEAQIPNVTFCMTCHMVIATDKPEIKKIAAYQARGEAIPWVRVYNYNGSCSLQSCSPHSRRSRLRQLPWRYDSADHSGTQSEFEHGLLRRLPQAKESIRRLRNLSLLTNRILATCYGTA
jgi:hypothetical protein